jgi:hypothetical protein
VPRAVEAVGAMAQWSSHHRRSTDSRSLWNFTLSPGWVEDEIRVLRLAIMKLGMGRWQEVLRFLPGKTVSQLNLQAQRMFGQQSLGGECCVGGRWEGAGSA